MPNININVAPVFNVGGSQASSDAAAKGLPPAAPLEYTAPHEAHSKAGEAEEEQAQARGGPEADAAFGRGGDAAPRSDAGEEEAEEGVGCETDEAPVPESPPASEPAEEVADSVSLGGNPVAEEAAESLGSADAGPAGGGGSLQPYDGQDGPGDSERDYAFDADFEEAGEPDDELGAELLDDYVRDPSLLAEPEAEAPATDEPQGGAQFIFGDNLDQMRTAAIGLVMRHARTLMPFWTTDSDVALIELRNFTMGVSEGRWPDDAGRREELDGLEATLSRIGAITQARDAKVEFLESASREEIEAFDYADGWP